MRITKKSSTEFATAFGIEMAGLSGDAFGGNGQLGLSWARVQPGQCSAAHKHDELEVFVIMMGQGTIHSDEGPIDVEAGDVIEFAPFERHIIENSGSTELSFLDIYWRDLSQALKPKAPASQTKKPLFVFSTPPTPNGDLHLGHLSGPYLGADIFTRFQRLKGRDVYHLTGSDDYQSYVAARAVAEDTTPTEISARYSAEIRETLALLDCHPDQYTVTDQCAGYAARIRAVFDRVLQHPGVAKRQSPALFDRETLTYRYEPDVSGACPDCGNTAGGNICEECGAPNLCHDLGDVNLSQGTPEVQPIERIEIDLSHFRDAILAHADAADMPERIRDLALRVLSRKNPHFPISHPSSWGIPAPGKEDQVIWVWPEMAFGFLVGIEELGSSLGTDWQSENPSDDWEIVHFFGFDNSFYHTILYPALYAAALPEWTPDISYVVNEFYLLDGKKFSTSRRHAIWGKDILNPNTVDRLRLYLCLTRPETARSNFSLAAFERFDADVFEEQIMGWLKDIFEAAHTNHASVMPDAGDWTRHHIHFLEQLNSAHQRFSECMNARNFSARRAARVLIDLVATCNDFTHGQRYLRQRGGDRARTVTSLEFCAAGLLRDMAAALMPGLAMRLHQALGGQDAVTWPDTVSLLPHGTRLMPEALFNKASELVTAAE